MITSKEYSSIFSFGNFLKKFIKNFNKIVSLVISVFQITQKVVFLNSGAHNSRYNNNAYSNNTVGQVSDKKKNLSNLSKVRKYKFLAGFKNLTFKSHIWQNLKYQIW